MGTGISRSRQVKYRLYDQRLCKEPYLDAWNCFSHELKGAVPSCGARRRLLGVASRIPGVPRCLGGSAQFGYTDAQHKYTHCVPTLMTHRAATLCSWLKGCSLQLGLVSRGGIEFMIQQSTSSLTNCSD